MRAGRLLFAVFGALFFITSFGVSNSLACSCVAPDPAKSQSALVREAYKSASAVFLATVTEIKENPEAGNKRIKLLVTKSWKSIAKKTVYVTTGLANGADCGYPFVKAQKYLIYGFRDEDGLSTNICLRTAKFDSATGDIKVLNRIKKPRNF